MESGTRWFHYVSYVFGGVFLGNTIPHLVAGVMGSPFQSPFASPPGVGLSSATVNVLWGMFNLAAAYLLLVRVGRFEPRRVGHAAAAGLGMLFISIQLAQHFGALHGGDLRAADAKAQAPGDPGPARPGPVEAGR